MAAGGGGGGGGGEGGEERALPWGGEGGRMSYDQINFIRGLKEDRVLFLSYTIAS